MLDTHAALWYLRDSRKVPDSVLARIAHTGTEGDPLFVCTVSVLETLYLVEKGRVPGEALDGLVEFLSDRDSDLVSVPLTMAVLLAARQIPREEVPADMPDRIIAATALLLGMPLIIKDRMIQASGVETIW